MAILYRRQFFSFYSFLSNLCHIFANVYHLSTLFVAFSTFLLMACSAVEGSIMPSDLSLQPGDGVLRRGRCVERAAVLMADRTGAYSHIGIIVDSAGVMMVVHAVPGEPDFPGDPDRVKMEPPETFFDARRAQIGEVRRMTDSLVATRAALAALNYYRRGLLFDHDYDTADSTRLYCTELVVRAYKAAGCPIRGLRERHYNLPGINITCLLPTAIDADSRFGSVRCF